MGSVSQPIIAATEQLGVYAPLLRGLFIYFIHPVYRLSTAPVSDETPLHRLAASDRQLRIWRRNWLPFSRRSTRFAMGGWSPPQSIGFAFVPIQGTGGR